LAEAVIPVAKRVGEKGARVVYRVAERGFRKGLGLDFGKVFWQILICEGIYLIGSMIWRASRWGESLATGLSLFTGLGGEAGKMREQTYKFEDYVKMEIDNALKNGTIDRATYSRVWLGVMSAYRLGGYDEAVKNAKNISFKDHKDLNWVLDVLKKAQDYATTGKTNNSGTPQANPLDINRILDKVFIDWFIYIFMLIPVIILGLNYYSAQRERKMRSREMIE